MSKRNEVEEKIPAPPTLQLDGYDPTAIGKAGGGAGGLILALMAHKKKMEEEAKLNGGTVLGAEPTTAKPNE